MKNKPSSLAPLLEGFFIHRLMNQKRVSNETVSAYRDTFCLLLQYAQRQLGKPPVKLLFEDLNASLICNFLNYLEDNVVDLRNRFVCCVVLVAALIFKIPWISSMRPNFT